MRQREEIGTAIYPLFTHRETDHASDFWRACPMRQRFGLSGERNPPERGGINFEFFDAGPFEDRVADADHARANLRHGHLRRGRTQQGEPDGREEKEEREPTKSHLSYPSFIREKSLICKEKWGSVLTRTDGVWYRHVSVLRTGQCSFQR